MKSNPPLEKLKKERTKKEISCRTMSERVGISKSMYSYIENGDKRLSYEDAVAIAKVFGKTPDQMFLKDYREFFKNTLI